MTVRHLQKFCKNYRRNTMTYHHANFIRYFGLRTYVLQEMFFFLLLLLFFCCFFFFFLLYFLLSTITGNLKLPFFDDVKIASNGNYMLETTAFISNTLNSYIKHRIILILHFMLLFLCPPPRRRIFERHIKIAPSVSRSVLPIQIVSRG